MTTIGAALAILPLALAAPSSPASGGEEALAECRALVEKGEGEPALRRCGEALELSRNVGDREAEGQALHGVGIAHLYLGDYQQARAHFEQALAILRAVEATKHVAEVLNDMGVLAANQGRYEEGLRAMEDALASHRALGDLENEAVDLNNIATVQGDQSHWTEALENMQAALRIARQRGDRLQEAAFLGNLGDVSRYLGQYAESLRYFEESLPIHREVGDRNGEAVTLNFMGVTDSALRHQADAIARHEQALAIFRELKNPRDIANSLKYIGDALEGLGRHAQAVERYQEALALLRTMKDPTTEARWCTALAVALRGAGREEEALASLEEALPTLRLGKVTGEHDALRELMASWAKLRQPELAIFYGKQAVNVAQSVRADIRTMGREARSSFLRAVEATYRTLADLLLAEGRLPEAQQVLGLIQDEELGSSLEGDGDGQSHRLTLTPREAEQARRYQAVMEPLGRLGRELDALDGARAPAPQDEGRARELQAQLAQARGALRAFLGELSLAFRVRERGRGPLEDVPEVRALRAQLRRLGPGAAALYTLAGDDGYRVLLVTPRRLVARAHAVPRAELARLVQRFREAIQDPSRDPRPEARALYRILVGPVERDLAATGATTLLWSLDGILRYVPIAALHDGRGWLVERYALAVFTPSGPDELAAPRRRHWSAWGFGVSRGTHGFGPLPAVEEELREIIRTPGARTGVLPGDVVLDESFTREALFAALETQRRPVVHIATHFQFQPGAPAESFLVLGDGGRLTLREFAAHAALFRGIDVLSLSGCETAVVGGEEGGRELEGFAMLARTQGARAVLATLWSVEDRSTSRLMADFYGGRQTGKTKVQALRGAQLRLLRGRGGQPPANARRSAIPLHEAASPGAVRFDRAAPFAHPYYWAPFVLVGDVR